MERFEELLKDAFLDVDLTAADVPRLDLYMDQLLTLFEEGLAANKRTPADRLLTKTMVNNYSKERLIMPIKGKKYSREQIMQLLCIINLKQNLALGDLKTLIAHEDGAVNFQAAYELSLTLKERLRTALPPLLRAELEDAADLSCPEKTLALTLALSSGATFLRRACEKMIDRETGIVEKSK